MKNIYYLYLSDQELRSEKFKYLIDDMSKLECLYINKYKRIEDRNRALLGTYIVKNLYNRKNSSIELIRDGKKKPYIIIGNKKEKNFNISHSGNIIMVSICDTNVGVDVELIKEDSLINKFNTQQFSENPIINFFLNWVLKESYGKKVGKGLLTENLFETEFIKINEQVYMYKSNYLHIFYPERNYIACICAESPEIPDIIKLNF